MSVRQEDIARHLGLSITTVSLALRDSPEIAEATRHLIRETATQLGYVHRSRSTFSFDLTKLNMTRVAFAMQYTPTNSFYGAVLLGAESECRQHNLILHYTLFDETNPRLLKQCKEADALLLVGSIDPESIQRLCELERPVVLVDNHLPQFDVDQILTQNTPSIIRTVTWLYQQGHRKIAFLRGDEDQPSLRERVQGYRETMVSLGLELMELHCPGKYLQQSGEKTMEQWLSTHHQPGFTALIGCNDDAAIGALHTLQNRGVVVPKDVSIVGFDDVEMAQAVWPQLTTNHVHREQMGSLAIQQLIERSRITDRPSITQTLGTTFIERASTRSLL